MLVHNESEEPFVAIINCFFADDSFKENDIKASINWYYKADDVLAGIQEKLEEKKLEVQKEERKLAKKERAKSGEKTKGRKPKNQAESAPKTPEKSSAKNTPDSAAEKTQPENPAVSELSPAKKAYQQCLEDYKKLFHHKMDSIDRKNETIKEEKFLKHPFALYASKHYDVISVASISDKCDVLTVTEYFSYLKRCAILKSNFGDECHVAAETIDKSFTGNTPSNSDLDALTSPASTTNHNEKIITSDVVSIMRLPGFESDDEENFLMEDGERDFLYDLQSDSENYLRKRIQPKPCVDGANALKSSVYFCPGMYDIKERKIIKDMDFNKSLLMKKVKHENLKHENNIVSLRQGHR